MLHLCFLKKATAFLLFFSLHVGHKEELFTEKTVERKQTAANERIYIRLLHANTMTSGSKLSASFCDPVLIKVRLKGYGGVSLHSITTLCIHIIHCVWNVFIHLLSLQQPAFPPGFFILSTLASLFLNTCNGLMAVWWLTVHGLSKGQGNRDFTDWWAISQS